MTHRAYSSLLYAVRNILLDLSIFVTFHWHQRADESLVDPPSKVDPGAFSGQRQGWKTPKRTLWQCTASMYSRSALLGDLLGISRSMERDLLSVLSIYLRIFLHVFIVYRLLVGFLFVLLYSAICSCVDCFCFIVNTY